MRKPFLAAWAALLFLLPAMPSLAASFGAFDPPERDEYVVRWGEGFQTEYRNYFSTPLSDRGVWQNRAYVYGEYGGYDWSVSLRGGATTFSGGGMVEFDPVPYAGATLKALVWASPDSAWTVGSTVSFEQALPFDTGGSRPSRISGLYDARAALGIQKRLSAKESWYGGPFYGLSGFRSVPHYSGHFDNGMSYPLSSAYYKLKDHVGLHGGAVWTLPGIDLRAEGQLTLGGISAGVSFRLPLEGGASSVVPRSIRELLRGTEDRPREEKDGRFQGPIRDDGPEEILPVPGEEK